MPSFFSTPRRKLIRRKPASSLRRHPNPVLARRGIKVNGAMRAVNARGQFVKVPATMRRSTRRLY